jgi:8-oxo-dGTP pyrophosphatase MutT (NUDIX family)
MKQQPEIKRKVNAYILRENSLLVFRHTQFPEAGIQVPAGSVEPGESLETAVLREAVEETGLTGLRLGAYLGEDTYEIPQQNLKLERHFYLLEADPPLPEKWLSYEYKPSDGSPGPIEFEFFWMPLDLVKAEGLAGGQESLLGRLLSSLNLCLRKG